MMIMCCWHSRSEPLKILIGGIIRPLKIPRGLRMPLRFLGALEGPSKILGGLIRPLKVRRGLIRLFTIFDGSYKALQVFLGGLRPLKILRGLNPMIMRDMPCMIMLVRCRRIVAATPCELHPA